jgi:hypothetical protein
MLQHSSNWSPFVPAAEGLGKYGWSGIARGSSVVCIIVVVVCFTRGLSPGCRCSFLTSVSMPSPQQHKKPRIRNDQCLLPLSCL